MSLLGSWVNRGKVPPSSRYKPFGCLLRGDPDLFRKSAWSDPGVSDSPRKASRQGSSFLRSNPFLCCLKLPTESPPRLTPSPRHSSVPMPVAVFARPNSSSSVSRTSLDAGPYSLACVKPSPLRAATSPLNRRQHRGAGSRVPLLFRTNDSL